MSENRFWNLLAKKLSGDASPGDIAELEQLMKENPEWVFSAEHIENLWNLKVLEANDYDAELAFELHLHGIKKSGIKLSGLENPASIEELTPPPPKNEKRKWIRLGLVSGVCILLLLTGIQFFSTSKMEAQPAFHRFSEVTTPVGAKSTKLVLPDSTIVYLNAGSRLTYNEQFGKTNRNTVLSGEGYFEVTKSTVPFTIKANDIKIQVLGTAFNVRSYPNEKTETTLIHGKIEITMDNRPGEKIILRPNEKLVVAPGNKLPGKESGPKVILSGLTRTPGQTIIETSWKDNLLIFQDESFLDVAKKMERWYNVEINIMDDSIAHQRLTGTFEKESIVQALTALQIVYPFRFVIHENKIQITP